MGLADLTGALAKPIAGASAKGGDSAFTEVIASAVRAKAAADYPTAVGLFRNALAIIAAEPTYRGLTALV